MKYYGQTIDGVNMSYISNNPNDVEGNTYTKETNSDGLLDTKVSEWLPYEGTFDYCVGVVDGGKFIAEDAYDEFNLTEDDGIPAVLYKRYSRGVERSIFVCKETTAEYIPVIQIILMPAF